MKPARLEAFTYGVVAIIIAIAVLERKVSEAASLPYGSCSIPGSSAG